MTTEQELARRNNWQILQLRGMYATIQTLNIPATLKVSMLEDVDTALVSLGGDRELAHRTAVLADNKRVNSSSR
jgi:hypothetical protein